MAKIILIGSAHPFRGGLATFNERLCRELISMEHEVELYTFTVQYPSFLFPGKTQFSDAPAPGDLKIFRRVNSVNPLNWISVGNEIKKKKPDLVLFKFWLPFMGPCFGTIARIAKGRKTKVISILDNVIPHEKRVGDVAMTKYFLNACDAFITMSSVVTEDLKKFAYGKKFIQHPHPLYDNFGFPAEKAEAKREMGLLPDFNYLLFFGFIRKYKGLDLAIEAMADPRVQKLPVKLIIAGEFYEDEKPYRDLISKFQLDDRVILQNDFIPEEDVKKYFSAADLLVLPYRSSTQSGVTQIAFHFDKPVIVTKVGGLPEFVKEGRTGFCVDPNPTSIADAIVNFYEHDLEKSLRSAIAEEKKAYSWNSFATSLMNLFQQL